MRTYVSTTDAVQILRWAAAVFAVRAEFGVDDAERVLERYTVALAHPAPNGRYVRAATVAKALRLAAQQPDRAGHWAAASELLSLDKQLETRGE